MLLHQAGATIREIALVWHCQQRIFCIALVSLLVFFCGLRYQARMANDSIDKLARLLAEAVPQGLRSVRDDLENNFRTVLMSGVGKLELVTREEFEVQQAVLARTREKLEALEVRLGAMEAAPARKKVAKKTSSGKKSTKKSAKKPAKQPDE
jgi:BMFP domain-containing protein YqiC